MTRSGRHRTSATAARDRPRPDRDLLGDSPSRLRAVSRRLSSWLCRYRCGPVRRSVPSVTKRPGNLRTARGIPEPAGKVSRERRWLSCQCPLRQPLVPTCNANDQPNFFRKISFNWNSVTESNRRSSPYHACRIRLPRSRWVVLPQPRRIFAYGYVALRLSVPGAVVTWQVTGSGTRPGLPVIGNEPLIQCPSSSGCSGAADGSSGSRLTRSRSVLAKSSPTHSSGSPATEATA